MFDTLRGMGTALVAAARTRLELAATELEEEALRLATVGLWALIALVFFALGLALLTAFVLIVFWDSYRLAAAGALTLVYLAIGAAAALVARSRARSRPQLLAETLRELERDRERLAP